jgi:hypothetical protein
LDVSSMLCSVITSGISWILVSVTFNVRFENASSGSLLPCLGLFEVAASSLLPASALLFETLESRRL